jgi:dienelactone hydrolase
MQKLIILSDLWGKTKSEWVNDYITILKHHFDVTFYDSSELANIDLSDSSEEKIHQQFIYSGIDNAVKALLDNAEENVHILGFSIGGLIAWKATLEGLKAESLTALSSMRLRFEDKRPEVSLNLYYAENDKYRPDKEWFIKYNLDMKLYKDMEHEFYKNKSIAIEVCNMLINQVKANQQN